MKTLERWAEGTDRGGKWWPWGGHTMIECPDCGNVATLDDHKIAGNGKVEPSVVCPEEGCGFHEFVTLEGWAGHQEGA